MKLEKAPELNPGSFCFGGGGKLSVWMVGLGLVIVGLVIVGLLIVGLLRLWIAGLVDCGARVWWCVGERHAGCYLFDLCHRCGLVVCW